MIRARASRLAPLALALLAGCAPVPGAQAPAPVPAPASAPATSRAPAPSAAVRDSSPSAAALAVLATIPEPLSPAERTAPPPAPPLARAAVPAPADSLVPAAPDSGVTEAAADTAGIPVPRAVAPLGANVPAAPPPPELPAPPPAAAPAPAPATPAASDTCWRVQVGAPLERARSRQLRDASESLLLAPMVVEREAGRYKVRTRDCLARATADALRDRAIASGFKGVFLVRVDRAPR